jgi:hypothetical protein
MAANTPSVWTESRVGYTGGSLYKATCTVLADAANTDASTLKTPIGLNVRRPWTLILSCATTPDGQALPFEIWGGTSDAFVMSLTAGSATGGVYLKQLSDDVVLSVAATPQAFTIIPNTSPNDNVADIVTIAAIATGFRVRVPVMPYYAFNLNGGSTLAAVVTTYTIIQG